MVPPDFLALAMRMVGAARAETLPRFRENVAAENKAAAGYDPVTEADRAAERAMRALIEATCPDHGIAGEEYGIKEGAGRWTWSLDPIDGTRAFVCGLPSWTTLIALLDEGEPVLGVIDAPVLDGFATGWGGSTLLNGAELRTGGCETLAEARLSTTDPFLFTGADRDGFDRVRRASRVTRYGLDAYAYLRMAAGTLDLVIEAGLHPHDWHALVPVVEGAGGFVCDWEGGRDLAPGRIVAAANEALATQAVSLLRG